MDLSQFSKEYIYQVFLVFTRISFAISNMPALGERYINSRLKLAIVLFLSLIIHPMIMQDTPKFPNNILMLAKYAIFEVIVGLMLGFASRICFLSLDIAGNIIGMQSGLNAASFFDPNQHSQVNVFSTFLSIVGIASILASDTHHIFISGIVGSYKKFRIGDLISIGDVAKFISSSVNDSFVLGFKISAPFLVVNIAVQVGSGILARLMPNLQVFFIITPAQILITFAVVSVSLSEMIGALLVQISSIYG